MKRFVLILLIAVFTVFWLKGILFLDPDFGYRLRTGKLVLEKGFPASDPYSYTMPSFPYVEHAWLIGVFWAFFYPIIGYLGLSLISSVLAISALMIAASRVKNIDKSQPISLLKKPVWYFGSFIFLLALATLLPFFGVRAQVVSWVFIAILARIVFDSLLWEKWKKFLPVYFFLWANIHGSFLAGVLIVFLVIVVKAYRLKKLEITDLAVFLLSLSITLINPYGFGIWREALSSITDSSLRWSIVEWMPTILMVDFSFVAFLTLSVMLVFRYRKKIVLEELVLYLIVFIQAMLSRRHFPLWVIIALPMTINSLNLLYQEIKGVAYAKPRFTKMIVCAWFGSLLIFILQSILVIKSANNLSETNFYPKDAITFLSDNQSSGQLFSSYAWGGYLIWKYPQKKVFIDGRMPSWRLKEAPTNETNNAFGDFGNIVEGRINYQDTFEKYNIDTVLWPVDNSPSFAGFFKKLTVKLENLLGEKDKDFDLLETLKEGGFEEVYQDQVAIIYQKLK